MNGLQAKNFRDIEWCLANAHAKLRARERAGIRHRDFDTTKRIIVRAALRRVVESADRCFARTIPWTPLEEYTRSEDFPNWRKWNEAHGPSKEMIERELRKCWIMVCEQALVRGKDATACWFGKTLSATYRVLGPTLRMPRVYGTRETVALINAIRAGPQSKNISDIYGEEIRAKFDMKEPRRHRSQRAFVRDIIRSQLQSQLEEDWERDLQESSTEEPQH